MNFFVTGVGGQLGHDVMNELLKRGHEGVGSDIQETYSGVADGSAVTKAPYVALDITDKEAVEKVITEVNPDAVIHCAAWTAVDMAEDDDKVAKVRAINAGGTQNIADVCKKLDCKMTYISTDYVFDGQGTEPWQPDCKDYKPLNVYGQTKLEGELAVSQTLEKYFIVRIAWVFGLNGKNFIKTMDNDFTPLRNLFNEWLVRDTSKKIKAVKKAKGMSGKPVTSKPVYGYLMDKDENYIVDEEAAPVVRQIYQLCLAGNGPTKIARMLTEQQIPTPGTLEYRRTGSTRRYHPGYECKWATNTVVHLLENREYTGCLVNFKTEKPSYKVKHSVENPIEKQAIFPNHHEPIIDTETWERVQELRKQRKRPNRYDEVGLFSGMLFCADCGHVLYQQRYQNKNRKQDCYICGSYKKRTRDCTAHFIRTDLLTAGVLSNLRQVTEYAARHESRFVKLLIQQNEIGGKRKTAAATKQLEQAQTRIAEVNRIIKRLYEDNVSGKISDERFMELSADYEQEQRELKDRAAALQEELSKSQAATVNAEKFMGIVRKHLAFEELTPTLLREMIEKIVVHECSYDENGTRRQDIEIYYSFVGKIDLPEA